jgi:peptidyl-prolyl cis-trans isomerase SurA
MNAAPAETFPFLTRWRRLGAAILVIAATATGAAAQNVVVFVNGEPITALDIEQRTKFTEVSTHKAPSRQEVIDDLINDKLKVREGKKYQVDVGDSDVDSAFATMAGRMNSTPEQFSQQLAKIGASAATLKLHIRAEITWQQLVRGRYQSSLQVGEQDILAAMIAKKTDEDDNATSYDYSLRPILFIVPPGSQETAFENRKREAEALRARFRSCDDGLLFARALHEVTVQPPIARNSADLPPELRKGLDSVPVGQLTAPEVTKAGIQMFAVCTRTEAKGENSPGKKKARESLFAERFEQKSKQYLDELRRTALIEYR